MAEKRPRRDLIDIEDTVRLIPPGATQHSIFSKPTVQEPANIADRSSFAEEPSSYASYEGHVHPSKMQHAQDADAGGQGLEPHGANPSDQNTEEDPTFTQTLLKAVLSWYKLPTEF
ncbi:hypothetical protein N0V95_002725 [Ascochyta clinopodiicola]|nr:hypothetical protein N0V95_002725 [Ascochyta clinopodiicola]